MEKARPFKFRRKVFAAGVLSIGAGYALLAFAEISISPVLLVLGYCVLIPLSFL